MPVGKLFEPIEGEMPAVHPKIIFQINRTRRRIKVWKAVQATRALNQVLARHTSLRVRLV